MWTALSICVSYYSKLYQLVHGASGIYAFVETLFRTEEGTAYMIVKMAGKGGWIKDHEGTNWTQETCWTVKCKKGGMCCESN